MPNCCQKTTEEAVTFFGRNPSEVLRAFHESGLSSKGYCIACRIIRQTVRRVDTGSSRNLFDVRRRYAGTFIRHGVIRGTHDDPF